MGTRRTHLFSSKFFFIFYFYLFYFFLFFHFIFYFLFILLFIYFKGSISEHSFDIFTLFESDQQICFRK